MHLVFFSSENLCMCRRDKAVQREISRLEETQQAQAAKEIREGKWKKKAVVSAYSTMKA